MPVPTAQHTEEIAQLLRRHEAEPRTHAFVRLAELYRENGDLSRALRVVRGGLAHHPHYLAARLLHATVLRDLGHTSAAAAEFERILIVDAANPEARIALGRPAAGRLGARRSGSLRPAASRGWLNGLDAACQSGRGGDEAAAGAPPEADPPPAPAESAVPPPPGPPEPEPPPKLAAPPPPPATPSPPPGASPPAADLDTATLAALYVRQGLHDRAVSVYERMLARDPGNTRISVALEETRRMEREASGRRPSEAAPGALAAAEPEGVAAPPPKPDRAAGAMPGGISIREQLRRILDGEASDGAFLEASRRAWLDGLGPLG